MWSGVSIVFPSCSLRHWSLGRPQLTLLSMMSTSPLLTGQDSARPERCSRLCCWRSSTVRAGPAAFCVLYWDNLESRPPRARLGAEHIADQNRFEKQNPSLLCIEVHFTLHGVPDHDCNNMPHARPCLWECAPSCGRRRLIYSPIVLKMCQHVQ